MAGISRQQGRFLFVRPERWFTRADTAERLSKDTIQCLRCAGRCTLTGLCEQCDAELSAIAVQELRRYASEKEIREWCCMHYIDMED